MRELTIIENGLVITCDGAGRAGPMDLLVREGRILETAPGPGAFASLRGAATVVDASGRIITPGFVNAHSHAESLLLRERTRALHPSLWKRDLRLQQASRHLASPEGRADLRALTLVSFFTHVVHGTTCAAEYGLPADEAGFEAMLQAMRQSNVYGVAALRTWAQVQAARRMEGAAGRFLMDAGREKEFTVHGFETTLRDARELGVRILVHAAELEEDAETVRRKFRKDTGALLRDYGLLTGETLLVHLNHFEPEDLDIVEASGATVVISPLSSALKRTGYPSLARLCRGGIPLAFGTDWGAHDMMEELRFLHRMPLLAPGVHSLTAARLVEAATRGGARALGLGERKGSIEAGKDADLVFFSTRGLRPGAPPGHPAGEELAECLLNHYASGNIADVMIRGELVVRDGAPLTLAEEDLAGVMAGLVRDAFPDPGPPAAEPQERARRTVKVIPFAPVPPPLRDYPEGEAEGFTIVGKTPGSGAPGGKTPPDPARLPELGRDVRRVFGEDEP
ncbi:MAG: amidohydrolase family protein [Bacteroidota bacterium]